jgi:hypothetical protein
VAWTTKLTIMPVAAKSVMLGMPLMNERHTTI